MYVEFEEYGILFENVNLPKSNLNIFHAARKLLNIPTNKKPIYLHNAMQYK